jgi:hypothetical protein
VSEKNLQISDNDSPEKKEDTDSFEEIVFKVNRETNEIRFKDPKTGKEIPIKAKVEEARKATSPLTGNEFRTAWQKLRELGVSWTTDIPPEPLFKENYDRDATFWAEYRRIQKEYPNFPRELGTAVLHALLHPQGGVDLDQKSEIIRADLLTQEYRSEFFFKYAIKVPYFEDIDWEIVIKAHERGVRSMPKIAYALLMLTLRNPVDTTLSVEDAANEYREPEFITVAVNEELIENLMDKLITIHEALEKTQNLAKTLTEAEEEKTNGTAGTE